MKMWLKVDVSKKVCDGERQFFIKMMEGYEVSYKKILTCWYITRRRHLFEVFHTSSTVKTSKHVVKGKFLKTCAIGSQIIFLK